MADPSTVFAPDLLAGEVALVTGGGTNLGKAAAAELVACGATVVIAGRREDVLEETGTAIGCSWVAGDIRDAPGAEAIIAGVVEQHGRLDFLLNNAGGQYYTPAEGIAAKGWRAVTRLNIRGTAAMVAAAVPAMAADGGGTIVTTTVSPHRGMPAMAHTGAARAAVEALTKRWAVDHAEAGVAVLALAIGRFATESLKKYPPQVIEGVARSIPLQRLGTLEEYGLAVAMLASPLGKALSGSVVTLDGALDNWDGAWPQASIADEEGGVPTEERAAHAPR